MAATIKEIAAATNLSITTVSLVLNNKAHKIPESTRKLVLDTAKKLDYRPNQIAISLLTKKTKTIGLLIPDIHNNFFSALAKSVETECRRRGWTMILCNTGDHYSRDIEYINVLSAKGVDGVLYCMSSDIDIHKFQNIDREFELHNMPYIMIDRSYQTPGVSIAKIDHQTGGFLACEHLLQLGHTRIACITGPPHLEDSHGRLLGYMDALKKYEIDFNPSLIYNGNYQTASGTAGVQYLRDYKYTAVFCFNDLMAFGALRAFKDLGVVVPADVSLVGYDDISFAEMVSTPLTTVRQPITKVGAYAAASMIESIENQTSVSEIPIFVPELIVRESTAEPAIKDRKQDSIDNERTKA